MEKSIPRPTTIFWCYSIEEGWRTKEHSSINNTDELEDILEVLDYLPEAAITLGDELDFVVMHEHAYRDEFLFSIQIQSFAKILFAESLPAMLYVMEQVNFLINGHLRTVQLMEQLRDE